MEMPKITITPESSIEDLEQRLYQIDSECHALTYSREISHPHDETELMSLLGELKDIYYHSSVAPTSDELGNLQRLSATSTFGVLNDEQMRSGVITTNDAGVASIVARVTHDERELHAALELLMQKLRLRERVRQTFGRYATHYSPEYRNTFGD